MSNQKKAISLGSPSHSNVQFYYLLAAGIFQFLIMTLGYETYYVLEDYMILPSLLFLGAAFTQKITPTAKRQLLLCLLMVVWFLIAGKHHAYMGRLSRPAWLLSVYLMAFPFASLTGDGRRQKGLNMVAVIYLAASLTLIVFSLLLFFDCLPQSLQKSVYWDGARLRAMWHPNITACIFMIGIAFCLGFGFQAKKRWLKWLLWAAAALQFVASGITNSRTSILLTCALIGGVLFFCIFNGSWKRFLAGIAAALVVMAALFFTASALYKGNNDRLIAKYTAQLQAAAAETTPAEADAPAADETQPASAADLPVTVNESTGEVKLKGINGQGSFASDMRTLNGRTYIWRASLRAIREDPSILIWGTGYTGDIITPYNVFSVGHAHNSWAETLVGLGLPGLAIALIFTFSAVWSALCLLFRKGTDMWQKTIALLVICLLGAAFLEPYLFLSDRSYHFIDFLFFLCIGYMSQLREQGAGEAGNP